MTTTNHPHGETEDAILREIEAIVRAAEAHPGDAAPQAPDLEAVAQELGISVDALHAIRETVLG